jgi:ribosomal protein S18 acetylase RimI-like enzyme
VLTIRDAKLTDASALAALMCELGYDTTPAEMRRRLKSILCDVRYRTLFAELDGKACGMIGALAHPSYEHDDPSGRILALATLSTMRRRGIGRALVASAERHFAEKGIRRIAWIRGLRERTHTNFTSRSVTYETVAICKATCGQRFI